MAGMIETSWPGWMTVVSPSRSRTLSAPTKTLTWTLGTPSSSRTRRSRAGCSRAKASRTSPTVTGAVPPAATQTFERPPTSSRSALGTRTVTSTDDSADGRRAHRHHRWEVVGEALPGVAVIERGEHLARAGAEVEPGRVGAVGREAVPEDREVGVILREALGQRLPRLAAV